ncbi:MAG: NRDE family protein [Proteobacteria bacterium]|nr:NRDE family protein [Pseudomonadota bacterium]
MCTIAVIVDVVANARIVIAANRDEMYLRDTRAPTQLAPGIVGGVDGASGGTWLALRRDGGFAAVTNQRALAQPIVGVRSRGLAVRELAASDAMDAYVAALDPRGYASMNLVWAPPGERPRVAYLRHTGEREIVELATGVHVLCNDRLGAPGFPRGERLAAGIEQLRGLAWPAIAAPLQVLLGDHTHVAPMHVDHLGDELARELTATCIHTPIYGTRSTTLAAIGEGATIGYLHADGPPCVTPFADRLELLA